MYDVIYINIGKSRANLVCVYIKIFIKQRLKLWRLTENKRFYNKCI